MKTPIVFLAIMSILGLRIVQAQEPVNTDPLSGFAAVEQTAVRLVADKTPGIGTEREVECPKPMGTNWLIDEACQQYDKIIIISRIMHVSDFPVRNLLFNITTVCTYKVVFKAGVNATRKQEILDQIAKSPILQKGKLIGVYSLPPYNNDGDVDLFKAGIDKGYDAVVLYQEMASTTITKS